MIIALKFACNKANILLLSVPKIIFETVHESLVLYDFLVTVKAAPHECVTLDIGKR